MRIPPRVLVRAVALAALLSGTVPAPAEAAPNLAAFAKLGAWVDVYDYSTNAWQASGVMQAKGVKTIYLQTGRWNSPNSRNTAEFTDKSKVDWWIHSAHARGMKIVGWFLPAYNDMNRDVRRTVMIWTYRTGRGQRFDGVGIDIEYKGQMPSLSAWNRAVVDHAQRVRRTLGSGAPIAAITPPPLGMAVRPQSWTGFPWKSLARVANVFMPMGYWSYRTDCSSNANHCPYGYTKGNVTETRRLTGNSAIPVHAIGGVGDDVTPYEVSEFVRAARNVRAFGGSLYDYRTTAESYWTHLSRLNS